MLHQAIPNVPGRRATTLACAALLSALCGVAAADDLTPVGGGTVTTVPAATTPVGITLVAVQESNADQNKSCNIDPDPKQQTPFHVVASVTSSDPTVATVSVDSLDFQYCGQTLYFNVTAGYQCGTATISIAYDELASKLRYPETGAQAVTISDTSVVVNVQGTSCNGGGGNSVCAQPAAPAWANAILQKNGIKSTKASNLVSAVAQHMLQGATFDGVAKSQQGPYSQAVYKFLLARVALPKTSGPADAARPGWSCTAFQ